jgi:hypothetical protein
VEHINFWFTRVMLNCWTKTNAVEGNTEVPLVASKEVGLEVNAEKIKCTRQVHVPSTEYMTISQYKGS